MKSRRNKKNALRGSFREHRAQFEPLEPRYLLTAAAGSGSTEAAALASPAVTTALPAPTVSLPTVLSPINGELGTTIRGVWVADTGSDNITVTLSVQHGSLTVAGNFTVSGNGTSTIVLTGTAEAIYDGLNPSVGPVEVEPDDVEPHVADTASIVTGNIGFNTYPGQGLIYTASSGFSGTDVLTVSAYASGYVFSPSPLLPIAIPATSPTATSRLLLDVVSEAPAPVINAPNLVQPIGTSAPFVFQGAVNTISINDPAAGSQPIQVILAAQNGALTLSGTSGLTVSGNGTDGMTITGSVTDVNRALNGLAYKPGGTPIESDTIEISVSDLGNTGLRTPQTSSAFVEFLPQWLVLPATQNTSPGVPLVFNAANSNAILISDLYTANGQEQLRMSVTDGTMTLAETKGLTFVSGANGTGAMNFTGSATDIQNALAKLTFTPDSSFNGTVTLEADLAVLNDPKLSDPWIYDSYVSIQVGGSVSTPTPTPTPTISAPQSQTIGLSKSVVFSSTGGNAISVSDLGSAGGVEQLKLAVNEGTLTLGGTTGITVISGANGSGSLTILGTVSAIDAALNGLVYTPTGLFAGEDTLSLSYTDKTVAGGPDVASSTVSIFVATPNEGAPVIAPTVTQNATPSVPVVFTATNGNATSISVPGVGAAAPVQVTLSVGAGTLALSGTTGLTMVAGANDSSSMTIQGTVAAINAALNRLVYTPGSKDIGRTELDILVNVPGKATVSVPQGRVWIEDGPNVLPAPITVPANQNVAPSTPVVFSSVNGNAISINPPGATSQVVQITLDVTSTFGFSGVPGTASGTLTLSEVAGLTFTAGGNGTSSMTMTGSVADINRALNGLVYTPIKGNLYWDTINIGLNYPGSGNPQVAQGIVEIAPQAPINPAYQPFWDLAAPTASSPSLPSPVITLPAPTFPVTGSPISITGISIAGAAMVDVMLSVANGTLQSPTDAGLIVQGYGTSTIELIGTAAQVNAARITYTAKAGFSGSDTLSVNATALSELPPPLSILTSPQSSYSYYGPIFNGYSVGTLLSSPSTLPAFSTLSQLGWNPVESATTSANLALNVAPPTLDTPQQQTVRNPGPLVFSAADGNAISITDPVVGTQLIQVTLGVGSGTLTLSGTAGLSITAGGNATASMTIRGSLANIESALDGLAYTPKSGYSGTDTLNVSFSDLGHGSTASSQTLSASVSIVVLQAYVQPQILVTLPTGPVSVSRGGSNSLSGVSISENGNGPLPPIQVTLSVQHGTLNVADISGVTLSGENTSTLVMTGTVGEIEEALQGGIVGPPFGYYSPIGFTSATTGAATDATTTAATTATGGASPASIAFYEGLTYSDDIPYVGPDTLAISVTVPAFSKLPATTGSLALNVTNTGPPSLIESRSSSNYTIGEAPLTVDPGITVVSADPDLSGAEVIISNSSFGQPPAGTTLSFKSQNGITGSFLDGVLSLNGYATPAQYQAALRSVTFSTTDTTDTSWTVEFIAYDEGISAGNFVTEQVNIVGATPPSGGQQRQNTQHPFGTNALALGVQESAGQQTPDALKTPASTTGGNNTPTSTPSATQSGSNAGTSGSTTSGSTATPTPSNRASGRHQFAATDAAIADLDRDDLTALD